MNKELLLWKIKNGSIFLVPYNRLVKKTFYLSEKNVMKKQEFALLKMLNNSLKHIPYYKLYFQNKLSSPLKIVSDIEKFPIVDKHIISDNYDSFIADNKDKYIYSDSYTGGSTGEPFHLLSSGGYEDEFDLRWWKYWGYKKGDRILSISGAKIDKEKIDNNIFWKKISDNDIPFGSYSLSSLYINDNNANIYLNYIEEFQPSYFWGYVSSVYELACYAEKLNYKYSGNLKAVVLTSEMASPIQIEKIKNVFNTNVCLQYGHTEKCINAYTYDDSYRYRVEPLYGFVEILNEKGKHVNEGEIGEVVVTSLHNYVMPLIRYRTGDYAEYGGKDNRYMYLNKVHGRTQDYIFNRDNDKVLLTGLIFGQHFEAMGHIYRWQIEQFEKGKVNIHIIKGNGWNNNDEKELIKLFDGIGNVEANIDYVCDILHTPRGKSKMLVQHIKL